MRSCKGRPRFCPKNPLRRRSTTDCKPESIASHAAAEHALSYAREEGTLQGIDVLVISNALGELSNNRNNSTPAFAQEECDAVYEWVQRGGSLFLIAHHAPMRDASQPLARRFGVMLGNNVVFDANPNDRSRRHYPAYFSRSESSARSSPDHTRAKSKERISLGCVPDRLALVNELTVEVAFGVRSSTYVSDVPTLPADKLTVTRSPTLNSSGFFGLSTRFPVRRP